MKNADGSYTDKCPFCHDKGFISIYSMQGGVETKTCNCTIDKEIEKFKNSKPDIIPEPKPAFDIYALPVDQEELRLIKLALFEISEYLGSSKLAVLRQRVNSLMNNASVKLPNDTNHLYLNTTRRDD